MVLNDAQFSQPALLPVPRLAGSARGFRGPEKAVNTFSESENKHGVFLRFGDWPHNERSMNHAFGGHEDGVSVYQMGNTHAEPIDPDPDFSRYEHDIGWQREMHIDMHGDDDDFEPDTGPFSMVRDNDTGEEMRNRRYEAMRQARSGNTFVPHEDQSPGRRGHFVKGTVVGFGHDDEPLLHNVRSVGEWPRDAHRFVEGTDEPLFSMVRSTR